MEGKLLTVKEVAEYLKVHHSTVRRYAREGRLPYIRVAGIRELRFRPEDVEALCRPATRSDTG